MIQSADPDADGLPPVVIFGHRRKLRGEGPFLSLLADFERQLAPTDRLVVIGYSFRDDHVNQVIRRWTFERPREVVIVDPNWSETCGEKAIQEAGGMRGLDPTKKFAYDLDFIASGLRPRGEAGDRLKVTVVRERASESITDLF